MDMRVATSKNDNGSVEFYFLGIEHWDDFDLILGLLQQENNCTILSKTGNDLYAESRTGAKQSHLRA